MTNTVEEMKKYIQQTIKEEGFDENGDIKINFSDLCNESETKEAAEALNYDCEPAEGQGTWWISER